MLKWLLVVVIALALLGYFAPQLQRLGLGSLPGDVKVHFRGRTIYLPVTSTVLISLLLTLVLRVV